MTMAAPDTSLGLRLGTGVSFPMAPEEARRDGRVTWLSGPDLVRQSIILILDCDPGERVMRPTFGAGLRRHLMAPNTPGTRAEIARDVELALAQWEPRIEVREVSVVPDEDPAVVWISVAYAHVRDGSPATLEVPFDLGTGTR
jgi:phage baseplate assembly protein W